MGRKWTDEQKQQDKIRKLQNELLTHPPSSRHCEEEQRSNAAIHSSLDITSGLLRRPSAPRNDDPVNSAPSASLRLNFPSTFFPNPQNELLTNTNMQIRTKVEHLSKICYIHAMNDNEFQKTPPPPRGRGTTINPAGRFEKLDTVTEPHPDDYELDANGNPIGKQIKTEVYHDKSKSIIARNDSPDICFETSLNPYRGCEHGCTYCFARPTHEYLGLSAGLDFETRIFAKPDAALLLRKELSAKSWKPQPIIMSGVTDCYQPVERRLEITRSCLAVLAEFRNPCAIITKNALVTRDIDYLSELASFNASTVNMSVTTLDGHLARTMEPRASQPERRIQAIEKLTAAGIPVNVIIGPVIPGLNDHEIPQILERAAAAGASTASYVMLRLPYGVKDLFQDWLATYFPDRKDRVINRIRDVRGGELYNSNFGDRMRGEGVYAEQIDQMFKLYRRKYNLLSRGDHLLSAAAFRRVEDSNQMSLF